MSVEGLGAALEPVSAAFEPLVGAAFREVPAFVLFFGALFLLAIPFWHYVAGLERRKATLLASCTMSTVHGALVSLGGYQQLLQWNGFHVDAPNTLQQKLLNEFSMAYMIADFFFYLLPCTPDDYVFMVHHSISTVYLVGCLTTGHGAIGCIMMFFLGEVTSPVFNTFTISKELRHQSKAAFQIFRLTSPLFTVAFVGVRSVVAPPIVGWFVYSVWFRAKLLPRPWRVAMGSCVALGMVASQLWSYKLLAGYRKQRRKTQQEGAAAPKKQQ